jgi:hypothetical protein
MDTRDLEPLANGSFICEGAQNMKLSVIMNTARPNLSMPGFPGVNHLFWVIDNALRRQTFTDFEFIISDYLYDSRKINFKELRDVKFPVYRIPVEHSHWKDEGYVAISATKNAGAMYASGDLLFFIDDCCSFEANLFRKIVEIYHRTGTFPTPLHIREDGTNDAIGPDGKPVRDCRFVYFYGPDGKRVGTDEIIDNFDLYGYATVGADAFFRLNGYDEMFDGSRQMEDMDLGRRLKFAGYHISLNRYLVVKEQRHCLAGKAEHQKTEYEKKLSDIVDFKENLKCNGTYFGIRNSWVGERFYKANAFGLDEDSWKRLENCYLFDRSRSGCILSGRGCNWTEHHMKHPDARKYLTNPPVFDMYQMRSSRLAVKERFRVL